MKLVSRVMNRLASAHFKLHYWYIQRVFNAHDIDGLRFIDMRDDTGDTEELQEVLRGAVGRIHTAKAGFGELVLSHLKLVVCAEVKGRVDYPAQVFVLPAEGAVETNPHYLASRLVWAATFSRLRRDAELAGDCDLTAVRAKARAEQIRFVRRFADADYWEDYLKRHNDPFLDAP